MPDLSIVIPAFNEEDRIVTTLMQTRAYLKAQAYSSEIVVVSDGSRDNTRRVVEQDFGGGGRVGVRVLEYFPNRGKGYAVRYGMLRARGRVLMFMDADYAVPIETVAHGLDAMAAGYDIAMGSRGLAESRVTLPQGGLRRLSSRLYGWAQRGLLGLRYTDTQCGFKFFRQPVARWLFARQQLDSVIFDAEILCLARKEGFRVAEFPVQWRHVENSRIQYDNLRKVLFIFQELYRIRRLHGRCN